MSASPLGRLASLQPLGIAPPEFSLRTRVVMALRRIEFLRVVPTNHKNSNPCYKIQVYDKSPHHRIPLSEYTNGTSLTTHPTWTKRGAAALDRDPDVVVTRSLADLSRLHSELFQLARSGHKLEPCAFCLGLITYCGYSRVKPQRSMTWMHSSEAVAEKLSVYLNDLLGVVLKAKAFHTDHCAGQENAPMMFYRFLQPRTSHNTTASPPRAAPP